MLRPTDRGPGRDARREKPSLLVPCQVEVQAFEALTALATGNSPRSRLVLVFHFADLERLGLVDLETGEALLRVGDRLVAIRELRTGALIQAVRAPPGLYLIEAQPEFGLGGRNLLMTTFAERALGARSWAPPIWRDVDLGEVRRSGVFAHVARLTPSLAYLKVTNAPGTS